MRRILPPLDASARRADAEQTLSERLKRRPGLGELPFSLDLVLAAKGRLPEVALTRAQQLDARDLESACALAALHSQGGQQAQALQWAEKLQTLNPTDPRLRQFVQDLRNKR